MSEAGPSKEADQFQAQPGAAVQLTQRSAVQPSAASARPGPADAILAAAAAPSMSVSRVLARIGLLGNPSDGFGGACISLSLANYWAEVTLTPGGPLRFSRRGDAAAAADPDDGGCRLMRATLEVLEQRQAAAGTPLPPDHGFALSYSTTIPRQRGLSGSSAIAAAALNCLLTHYRLEDAAPVAERPALLLAAEAALGITAGLQDRVIQTYGGVLLMDFRTPQPRLQRLDPALLPPLWLIYRAGDDAGSDSGAVHSDVKQRWQGGDVSVRWGVMAGWRIHCA